VQPLDPVPRPLDHLALRGRADDPAYSDAHGTIRYYELEIGVGRMAAALRATGLRNGDRVASWLPKNRLTCLLPLAAARAGLVHVPINPVLRRAQAAHILEDSSAALLITNAARTASLSEDGAEPPCAVVPDTEAAAWLHAGEALPPSSHDPQALAALLYTSGSTGRPKGVMLSHANMWLGAVSVAHYLELAPADRTLAVLPLAFDYGQNQLLSTWAAGGAAIPLDYLTARDVVSAVRRHDVTTIAGVPPLWMQIADAAWPEEVRKSVRRLTNSGGAMPRPLLDRLRALFPNAAVHLMYGLTEAFRSTSLDPARVDSDAHTVGTAIPFAEVLVVAPDGTVARDDEAGELVHAGPLVAGGYWRDPERTAERFKPAPAASRYGGTAVWSGDRVRRGADGLITVLGRDDEMIKTSGNRVSPAEIEEAAMASGAVTHAAAFGVADERLGQAIALVARASGAAEEAEPRLRAWLSRELPAHMQPRSIHWREALPISPNGKFDRAALRRELGA
jgi:acyl-CoA ligase (AMP-forming) (exosortase A-associated)